MLGQLGRLEQVADDVYAYLQGDGGWCLSNAGIVCGSELTVLVDTAATERRTRALLDAIDLLGRRGAMVAVNTHFHGDHTFGNCFLPETVPIIAHPRTRYDMAATGLALMGLWPNVEWGDVRVRLPTVSVAGLATIHDPAVTVEVRHLGISHTTGDLVVWLPGPRVLFAGDQVLSGCTPFLLFGSVVAAKAALRRLRALKPKVVVPGHGAVGGPELIDATVEYLDWLIGAARDGIGRGDSPLALARTCGPGPFPDWIDAERHVANFHRAYADLTGVPPGAPLPVSEVFADVVTCCHHGYPLSKA